MIRIFAALIGLFFSGWLLWSFGTGAVTYLTEEKVASAEHEFHKQPKHVSFAHDGALGKYDKQQLQRGFQVFHDVCSACHSLRHVAFRNLEDLGYSEAEVKAIAANWPIQTPSINPDTGEAATRASLPADKFPSPYPNEVAARAANNGALPPDLSLITKARHHGPAYVYSLLTGYQDPPAELAKKFPDSMPGKGMHYNPYFANLNLAMAPPVAADIVSYSDGTKASVDQISKDVAAFLTWTAEPTLVKRRQTGWAVMIFLLIATGLGYMAYRNVWAEMKH